MIYLMYIENDDGAEVLQCRDEIHYMDMLVDVESRLIVPVDIRWHGDETRPAMRILALAEDANLVPRTHAIIAYCAAWLRKN